jgi:hypothetical protein
MLSKLKEAKDAKEREEGILLKLANKRRGIKDIPEVVVYLSCILI